MQEGGEDWESDSGSEEGSFLTVSPGGTEGNKEGWVWKESDMLRSWRRRWLSCKGGRLAYSRRPDEVTIANTSLISACSDPDVLVLSIQGGPTGRSKGEGAHKNAFLAHRL